jgi:phenylalanyl-tRNA synthetase alpha chain
MDLKDIKKRAENEISLAQDFNQLKDIEKKYLGKKGELTQVLRSLKDLSVDDKKKIGKESNILKNELQELIDSKNFKEGESNEFFDVTIPSQKIETGHLHPLTLVRREIEDIFERIGFSVVQGPEVETEYYNFDALNIPKDHPARDMWDTFWLKGKKELLRTHTSPGQVHYMEKNEPPFSIVVPGRVFRYEATDASHEINFYQVEGLMIGENVSATNFKAVIEKFFEMFFNTPAKIRLRPSFFPFTEPSFEVDLQCFICGGKGCSTCSKRGWLEMGGAGMVHPNVFKHAKLDPEKWQGFAFGFGLDRLAMMKYKIDDIRLFYSSDIRFLEQF